MTSMFSMKRYPGSKEMEWNGPPIKRKRQKMLGNKREKTKSAKKN